MKRKRMIKLLMAHGVPRNEAVVYADACGSKLPHNLMGFFEHDGDCCNCGSPQYMCKCKPGTCGSAVPMTNADRIRTMSDEELAGLIEKFAYGGETPWCDAFTKEFCDNCPETEAKVEGYSNLLRLHECDFEDGKCPHGGDIMWWLQQPAEEDKP